MTANVGEQILGEYLRWIRGCDFVEYNLLLTEPAGEIDVVGINSAERYVYCCESATHTATGLQYVKDNRPDNVPRFVDKFTKDISYAKQNFPTFTHKFILWTPIIKIPQKVDPKNNQFQDILEIQEIIKTRFSVDLELIYNKTYYQCLQELKNVALKKTEDLKRSPIMRYLQIEEKLKKHIDNLNKIENKAKS